MGSVLSFLSPKARVRPLIRVVAIITGLWYALAILLNYPRVSEQLAQANPAYSAEDLVKGTWTMERPVLPAPDQIAVDLWNSTAGFNVTSKRSLIYHASITASATLSGFLLGAF